MGLILSVETYPETNRAGELEKAFLENHTMVYRVAFRITGNASDAEDVLQTLFLRLIRREWIPDRQRGWQAYLHRSAINVALDIVRRRGRQESLDVSALSSQESRPDRDYSSAELRKGFTAALAELNPTAAEMFVLRYVEGYGLNDIAEMLNTSKGSVAVTLFRTRSRLRKSIRKFLGGS